MQQICDHAHQLTILIIIFLVEGSQKYLLFPLLKFSFLILQYFRANFREILMSGSREICVFPIFKFHDQSQFFDLLRMRYI